MGVFALNDYGQVGVFYKGENPPASADLIWHQLDAQGNHIHWKEKVNGVWQKIGHTVILDVLNSFNTDAALSANQGRILKALITDNTDDVDLLSQSLVNYLLISQKNQPGGYAGIGANGKIDPSVIDLDGLIPKDVWDASSGAAPSANPNNKEYWIVNVAGNFNLNGYNNWAQGDRALYINNDWVQIPATAFNEYNALDQLNAGFVLDARQGKVLKDLIDAQAATISSQAAELLSIKNRLDVAEAAITQLAQDLNDKMDPINILSGTISNEKFINAALVGIQYGQLEVVINGINYHVPGFFTKNPADNFIAIPGEADGAQILVKIYPQ